VSHVEDNERVSKALEDVLDGDRRCGPRFSTHLEGDETLEIWLDAARPQVASILNESMEGVGLILDDELDLQQGQTIVVVHRGFRRRAEVQYIAVGQDGCRLGLTWKQQPR